MKRTDSPPPSGPIGVADSPGPSSAPSSVSRGGATTARGRALGRGLARQLGIFSAIGVLSASLITVCVNVLAARFYHRWDVTSAGLYTLSAPTRETLSGLADDVDIIVFLSRSDPDFGALERLLDQYRAESKLIHVRYVDPDRDPAEFIALSSRYRLSEGRSEGGRLVSDAALVVARGDARWVVGAEDISEFDEEHGLVESRVEQSVTEGLRQVLDPTPVEVCVSSGLGEPALDDSGPTGLAGFAYTLRRNNYDARPVDLEPERVGLARPGAHRAGGEVDVHVDVAGAKQASGADGLAQRRRHPQQRLPPRHEPLEQVVGRRDPRRLLRLQPALPVRAVLVEVRGLLREDAGDGVVRHRMGDRRRLGRRGHLDARPRDGEDAVPPGVHTRYARRPRGKRRARRRAAAGHQRPAPRQRRQVGQAPLAHPPLDQR